MRHSRLPLPPRTLLSQRGIGLVDVLIALLLLSISLLSAGAATLRALQAGRSATLQMRATDLAADLNEELEAASSMDFPRLISDWQQRVVATLPVAVATIHGSDVSAQRNPGPSAHLQWKEPNDTAQLSIPLPQPRGDLEP